LVATTTCHGSVAGGYYDKEKDRLGNIMAYGEDIPPIDAEKAFMRGLPKEEPKVDRFDECKCIICWYYFGEICTTG